MSEREKFLGEGYVPTKIVNEHGFALLLPRETVEAIEKAQVAARLADRKVMEEKERLESQGENEAEAETAALSGVQSGSMRKVFDLQAISEVLAVRGKGDRERSEQLKDWAKLMRKSGGCRAVRRFPARLDDLREQFPNFSRVIDAVEALVAVGAADEQGVAVEPLLMVGPPGVGKTLFVEALADAAGVEVPQSRWGRRRVALRLLVPRHTGVTPLLGRYGNCSRWGARRTLSSSSMKSTRCTVTRGSARRARCWICLIRARRLDLRIRRWTWRWTRHCFGSLRLPIRLTRCLRRSRAGSKSLRSNRRRLVSLWRSTVANGIGIVRGTKTHRI